MKIAQLTSVYLRVPPRTHGGTERIVYYLCRELYRRGHAVELFASGDSQVDCPLNAVLPVASLDDPQSTVYLEKEFETRNTYNLYRQGDRFDIVHAHWPTLAPYFSPTTKTPTVLTYAYIEKELHDYYRTTFPRCFPVCLSAAQARMLGDESLPVVHNGIDLDEIPFNDTPEDFFLIVGRLTPGKGIAEAIRIAEKARVRLVIIGKVTKHLPWSEAYYLNEVKPHIDGDRIRHIEELPYEQVLRWMGRAKGFLFPLQWEEPFGMVVGEAMAAGAPVLAYPRGAVPEIVKHGETGFLARNEDEMIDALRAVEKIDRRRCRRWVAERFSVERMIEAYEAVYLRILGA